MRDLGCHPDLFQLAVVKKQNEKKNKERREGGVRWGEVQGPVKKKKRWIKENKWESLLHAVAASTQTATNKPMTSEVTDEPAVTDGDDHTDKYTSDPHGQQAG